MKSSKSLRTTINRSMIAVTIFSISMVGLLWVVQKYRDASDAIIKQKEEYIAARKTEIRTEVNRAISYIDFRKTTTKEQFENSIKARAYEANAIANNIYNSHRGVNSNKEIQIMIKEALRPLTLDKGRGYFFIYDLKGKNVLYPSSPHLEGKNLTDLQDSKGQYPIQETIKMIRENGEGFHRYLWYKPGETERMSEKIGYSKYFEPFDWFIGTGEYLEHFEFKVQHETLEWINKIRFGKDGYIFVYNFDGTILAHFLKEMVGTNELQNSSDPYGAKIVSELIRMSQQEGGGFFEYEGKVRPSTGLRAQKIGHSQSVKDWQWTVGAGVYVDAINDVIALKRKELISKIIFDLFKIFLILAFSLITIGVILQYISRRTTKHLTVFTNFFEQAATSSEKIDDDVVLFSEFKQLAHSANQMVDDRQKAEHAQQVSEERLDLALSATNQGVWDWFLDEDRLFFDTRYYTMAGYEPDEFPSTFQEWEKRIHPDDLPHSKKIIKEYLARKRETYEVEFRFQRKQGGYMWVLGRGKIVERDEDSNPTRFTGTHADITRQKQAEYEIKKLRSYLTNIIDSMPSVLIGIDKDGQVTQWNQKAYQETGVSSEEATGKPIEELYPLLAAELQHVHESIVKNQVYSSPKRMRVQDNENQFADITAYPLVANGTEGAVIRVDDVTERVKIEEMMIQSEKMLSVGGLAAGMAHEINNPLAGVALTVSNISNRLGSTPDLPANLKAAEAAGTSMDAIMSYVEARGITRMLENITTSSERIGDTVANMLSFSRKSDGSATPVKIDELVDKALKLAATDLNLKKRYNFKEIEIIKEYNSDVQAVPCEESKIQQVLLNIFSNGAQAMQTAETSSPRFSIRLYLANEQQMACIEIEDNGPGMKEEIRRRVFEPFFTTKPKGSGTGLGLSVSYFIITENHNGQMAVKSQLGEGTTFIIKLPVNGKGEVA